MDFNPDSFLENISEKNCNARLSYLYEKRDSVSHLIDMYIVRGKSITKLEMQYNDICDVIDELCYYRRLHPKCLTEGDEGYCLN